MGLVSGSRAVAMFVHASSDIDLILTVSMFMCVPFFVLVEVVFIALLSFQRR